VAVLRAATFILGLDLSYLFYYYVIPNKIFHLTACLLTFLIKQQILEG